MNTYAVVVTYNRKVLLQECLDALLCQTVPVARIIVVDNCSTDGTDELFKENGKYDSEMIHYHKTKKNIGGAGGFHIGMKLAYQMGAEWIWIMDDDTIPKSNAHKGFVNSLTDLGNERVSFLASSVYGPNGEAINVPLINTKKSPTGYLDWYLHLNKKMVCIESATFVSLLINSKAVEKCGLPLIDYFIWGDDYEYTLRITNNYGRAYICGSSEVIHKRAVCKKISIENETDPKRLPNYYYNYRNNLISVHEYKGGAKIVVKNILAWNWLCLKILFRKDQVCKWKKILIIHKGICGYLFGRYDKKQFKNRFTYDMQ